MAGPTGGVLAVAGDELVQHELHRGRGDPLAGVDAAKGNSEHTGSQRGAWQSELWRWEQASVLEPDCATNRQLEHGRARKPETKRVNNSHGGKASSGQQTNTAAARAEVSESAPAVKEDVGLGAVVAHTGDLHGPDGAALRRRQGASHET